MDWEGGGGFINDTASEEPQTLGQSVGVGGEEKNKSVTAVSVSQVVKLTRPNEGLVINQRKAYHVNLVALVYEIIDINSSKVHVLVDDYTSGGPLEVSHIIGDSGAPGDDPAMSMFNDGPADGQHNTEDCDERNLNTLKVGDYVRCIGVVKFNQDKPNVVAYNMRIVDDPNEVTMHILEVIRDSMYFEKLQSGYHATSTVTTESKPAMNNNKMQSDFGNLTTRDKHILKFLREKGNGDRGLSVRTIAENFKAFNEKDIIESLSTLSSEGHCWQGDEEDLWITNMGV